MSSNVMDATRNVQGAVMERAATGIDTRTQLGDQEDRLLARLALKDIEEDLKTSEYSDATPQQIEACQILAERAASAVGSDTHIRMVAGMDDDILELIIDHRTNGKQLVYKIRTGSTSGNESIVRIFKVHRAAVMKSQFKAKHVPVSEHLAWLRR